MSTAYESVITYLRTKEGIPLLVGGICKAGAGAYWAMRFHTLELLKISGGDLYSIDYAIACALQEIAYDNTLLIAGCSADAGLALAAGESTGGVLGSPHAAISSSPGICEKLPEGFSIYTAPGGPGLAALADPMATQAAAQAIKTLGSNASKNTIHDCLNRAGIETGLLVLDGNGPEARGCMAAASSGKIEILFLP